MTTAPDTAALRELESRATPRPWADINGGGYLSGLPAHVVKARGDDVPWFIADVQGDLDVDGVGGDPVANAALIVAARNALPALLDEIDTLRVERRELGTSVQVVERRLADLKTECDALRQMIERKNSRVERDGARIVALEVALTWYAEQAAGCRKLGHIGDPFRHALDDDGGRRAREAMMRP